MIYAPPIQSLSRHAHLLAAALLLASLWWLPSAGASSAPSPVPAARPTHVPDAPVPGVGAFVTLDGRFDLERARRLGFSGALDMRGFRVEVDPVPGEPRIDRANAGAGRPPGDDHWWDGFGLPIVDRPVSALCVYRGDLIAAGSFTQIGGVRVGYLARWDGAGWNAMAGGTDGPVYELGEFDGKLIVAGSFRSAGGVFTGPVAAWDGTTWSGLSTGSGHAEISGQVYAMEAADTALFVGGYVYVVGHSGGSSVARWSAGGWTPLGPAFDGPVIALAAYRGDVVAGGWFSRAGDSLTGCVARWDGFAWSPLGAGVPGDSGRAAVMALAEYRGDLIVGGQFERAGDVAAHGVARWNGTRWDSLSGTPPSPYPYVNRVDALFVDGDTLRLGGLFYEPDLGSHSLAVWDGALWRRVDDGLEYGVGSFARYGGRLVAGGPFSQARGVPVVGIAAWNGLAWESLEAWRPGMRGLGIPYYAGVRALVVYHGEIYAGGDFQFAGDPPNWTACQGLARWDGSAWQPLPGIYYGSVRALAVYEDALVVGGWFWVDGDPGIQNVARWDGERWHAFETGGTNRGVEALAEYQGSLYAGGWFDHAGGAAARGIARWDGTAWHDVGGGVSDTTSAYPYPRVSSLVLHAGRLAVGGKFSRAGGLASENVAEWDGASWSAVGPGVPGEVFALAGYDGDLVIGGQPGASSGNAFTGLARWDGSALQPMGGWLYSFVTALGTYGADLIVGGEFRFAAGNVPASCVARWDGGAWKALGSGTDGRVTAIAENAGSLYLGGLFTWAGASSSFHIARWDDNVIRLPRPLARLERAAPNPSTGTVELRYRLENPGRVKLTIYDLRGRRLATLLDGERPAGLGAATWTPIGPGGPGPLRAGIYFARLDSEGHASTLKIAIVP